MGVAACEQPGLPIDPNTTPYYPCTLHIRSTLVASSCIRLEDNCDTLDARAYTAFQHGSRLAYCKFLFSLQHVHTQRRL